MSERVEEIRLAQVAWNQFCAGRLSTPIGQRDDLWSVDEASFKAGFLAGFAARKDTIGNASTGEDCNA